MPGRVLPHRAVESLEHAFELRVGLFAGADVSVRMPVALRRDAPGPDPRGRRMGMDRHRAEGGAAVREIAEVKEARERVAVDLAARNKLRKREIR